MAMRLWHTLYSLSVLNKSGKLILHPCPAQSELDSKLMSKLRDAYCSEATSIVGRVRAPWHASHQSFTEYTNCRYVLQSGSAELMTQGCTLPSHVTTG